VQLPAKVEKGPRTHVDVYHNGAHAESKVEMHNHGSAQLGEHSSKGRREKKQKNSEARGRAC